METLDLKQVAEVHTKDIADFIKPGEPIIFTRHNGIVVCVITLETEKAVKVDCAIESPYNRGLVVYTYCGWIPKSQIIFDEYSLLTVKSWFAKNFKPLTKIKKYFFTDTGAKSFV
jgi:hypothetical protein